MKKSTKKLIALLFAVMMIIVSIAIPMAAFAEDMNVPATDVVTDITVPAEPFTWSYLATIAGAAVFTLLVVQFIKAPLDKVWKIPTWFLAYIIALVTMLVATALTTGLTFDSGLLAKASVYEQRLYY